MVWCCLGAAGRGSSSGTWRPPPAASSGSPPGPPSTSAPGSRSPPTSRPPPAYPTSSWSRSRGQVRRKSEIYRSTLSGLHLAAISISGKVRTIFYYCLLCRDENFDVIFTIIALTWPIFFVKKIFFVFISDQLDSLKLKQVYNNSSLVPSRFLREAA